MTDPVIGDPYAILGVGRDADDDAIVSAYRLLARRFHPDIAGETATERMMRINAAFDAIRTADRRAARGDSTPDQVRWTAERNGTGGAGPAPGRPSGSVLDFGRHLGWSIGEIARVDPGYLIWLEERREGRPYRAEIDATLRRHGYRFDGEAAHHPTQHRRNGRGRC
jgi:curved DNA-binding protein CbpA